MPTGPPPPAVPSAGLVCANVTRPLKRLVSLSYRGFDLGSGRLGFTWSNTFLLNYDMLVPGPSGIDPFGREGTQVGWRSV